MVIGYNPSHSNINSKLNNPFKILFTLLRFVDNYKNDAAGKYLDGEGVAFRNKLPDGSKTLLKVGTNIH